ncbi:MAG: IgGFc-binding protein [Myxococcota bacterium]
MRVFRGTSMVASVTVPPGGLQEIVLPWILELSEGISDNPGERQSFVVANAAYRVLSDQPVTVTQFNPFEYDNGRMVGGGFLEPPARPDWSFSNDASLLLPAHSFTGNYIGSSYSPLSIQDDGLLGPVFGSEPGYIAIIGVTPEPTTVNVSVSTSVLADAAGRFPALSAGGVANFTLQRGEVAVVVAANPPNCTEGRPGRTTDESGRFFCNESSLDLTGTRITSSNQVAVFGGHKCAYVPYSAQACDHLEAQMPPLETWGMNYASGPMADPSGDERNIVRVTSAFPATTVTVSPPQGGTSSLTLAAGEWAEFEATSAFEISATNGVMVTQYLIGQIASEPNAERGDPSMVVLPPIQQYRRDYTFVTPTSYNTATGGQSFLLVVRRPGVDVTLDGASINPGWSTVGTLEVGTITVDGGTHQMASAEPFGVIVYGMGVTTSYAYPAGLNLEEILLI